MAKKQAEHTDKYSWAVEGARVLIRSYPLLAGEYGTITSRPSSDAAVVEFGANQREYIPLRHLEQINKANREYLSLQEVVIDGGTQSRAKLNLETVDDYALDLAAGAEFPPIEVYYDGSSYWLADGFHRLAAYKKNQELDPDNGNWQNIAAKIHQGDRRQAILHSVGANSNHGLRRTNADKRRAVTTLLMDKEWKSWSDREISKRCGVDHKFVGKLRKEVTGDIPSEDRTYTTKHGTEATMNTANIGSRSSSAGDVPSEERPDPIAPPTEIEITIGPRDLVLEPKSKKAQLLSDVERNGDVPPGEPAPTPASLVNLAALNNGTLSGVATEWTIGFMSNIGELSPGQREAIGSSLLEHLNQDQLEALVSKALVKLDSDRYVKAVKDLDSERCRVMVKANKQVLNERSSPEHFKGESA